jgi:selenocysteine lyase/cysteine desulfurase
VSEHNSVLRPLYLLERAGVEVDYIGVDEKGVLLYDTVESLIKPNTRAFVLTHASNVTGNVTRLDFFAELKKRYGVSLVVDGAQTAGIIPVDVQDYGIDVYCFTGHKGLLGPQGTGGLYLSPKADLKIKPLKVGGSGVHSFDKLHPETMPEALEAGTLNCHGLAGLKAATEYIAETGVEKLRKDEFELAERLVDGLKGIKGVKLYGDYTAKDLRVPIVAFNVADMDSGEVSDILFTDYNIASRPGAHCAPMLHTALGTAESGIVRLSLGLDITAEDVEKAVVAVREIASV